MSTRSIGIWLVGAAGSVATTTAVALGSLARGGVSSVGLTTGLEPFARLDLPAWDAIAIGGHEIRDVTVSGEARRLAGVPAPTPHEGFLPAELVEACSKDLAAVDRRIRPGTITGAGATIARLAAASIPKDEPQAAACRRLQTDIEQFADDERLEHVIVVNVASTEPSIGSERLLPEDWPSLERRIEDPTCQLPASTLYAIAALKAGADFINFTPSLGSQPPAVDDLARRQGLRHMGCDGKTGETLMKSVLAPMFARRNLEVMSWVGHNIFGNLDGRVLDDPTNKATKVHSKDHLLAQMLPNRPQTHVSIELIESLGEWKTAWDHIHFRGLLGVPMTLQFTWQGCDSILAAPLVLDLVRFTELARRRGHVGQMPFLASFFKSPYGVAEQAFDRQFAMLERWAGEE